jgi:hypothetical protein
MLGVIRRFNKMRLITKIIDYINKTKELKQKLEESQEKLEEKQQTIFDLQNKICDRQKKFSFYKQQILDSANSLLANKKLHIDEEILLISDFVNIPLYADMNNDFTSQHIKAVVFAGKESGQLYFIALNTLIPNL